MAYPGPHATRIYLGLVACSQKALRAQHFLAAIQGLPDAHAIGKHLTPNSKVRSFTQWGRPGIARAECSGACNERDARVEILAVQRSAVRGGQYRNGRVELRAIFSPAHKEGCSPRCILAPNPHGGAQQPNGARAANAGAVRHDTCPASHCPLFVIESIRYRRVASTRRPPVRAKRKSQWDLEAP
jgi:hypothetical protein